MNTLHLVSSQPMLLQLTYTLFARELLKLVNHTIAIESLKKKP